MSSVHSVLIRPRIPCWRPAAMKVSIFENETSNSGAILFQMLTPVAMNFGMGSVEEKPARKKLRFARRALVESRIEVLYLRNARKAMKTKHGLLQFSLV